MENKGLTYVELLAAIVISAIVMGIIYNIGFVGLKQGEATKSEVTLQQEANYVATKLRNEYLKVGDGEKFNLKVEQGEGNPQLILNDSQVISDKHQYTLRINQIDYTNEPFISNYPLPVLNIEIKFKETKSGATYTLRTTLARGV